MREAGKEVYVYAARTEWLHIAPIYPPDGHEGKKKNKKPRKKKKKKKKQAAKKASPWNKTSEYPVRTKKTRAPQYQYFMLVLV